MLHRSVVGEGWPAPAAIPALLAVTGDPASRSPARLAAPGPWWDVAERTAMPAADSAELAALETRLVEADGHRVHLQRLAREQLTAEGMPVTRLGVARRACDLLEAHDPAARS